MDEVSRERFNNELIGLQVAFTGKEYAWTYIYRVLYYHVREYLAHCLAPYGETAAK